MLPLCGSSIALLLLLAVTSADRRPDDSGFNCELCDYVYRDDGFYEWSRLDTVSQNGVTSYYLNMTSQKWYDYDLTNRPIWWHYIIIHVPTNLRYTDAAFMYITGSSNHIGGSPPSLGDRSSMRCQEFANETGIIAITFYNTPNQPIVFENETTIVSNRTEPRERVEDDLISWTWARFVEKETAGIHDPELVARMPMTKGVVKGMDAVQEFIRDIYQLEVSKFMIAGESKRGWTAWLAGAIDDRVIAMAPVVLSMLNMNTNLHHYYQSYGGWPYYFWDYWKVNLTSWMDSTQMTALQLLEDPWYYRHLMNFPKYMISAASDEFFMPDDSHYFWTDLPGEKYFWIISNTGHWMSDGPRYMEYWRNMQTFYLGVLQNFERPIFTWERLVSADRSGGSIVLTSPDVVPNSVNAYYALSNPNILANETLRRDWRLKTFPEIDHGITWYKTPVTDLGGGTYSAYFKSPMQEEDGFICFYIEVAYPGPEGREFVFTTEVHVLPDVFPFEDCSGTECQGFLK